MNQLLHICTILFLLILTLGCRRETVRPIESERVTVELEFEVGSLEVTPRALEMGDSEASSTVRTITLFAVDGSGSLTRFDFDYGTGGAVSGLIPAKIDLTAGTYDLYAVANASPELGLSSVTTKAELMDKIVTVEPLLTPPLVMTATVEGAEVGAGKKIAVRLERVAAMIDLHSEALGDFTIESVTVHRTPSSSYLFPHTAAGTPNQDGWPELPAGLTSVSPATALIPNSDGLVTGIYLYESFNSDAANFSNNVSLIVKGTYKGTEGYYRIDIPDYRGRQWIRRNTRYDLVIKEVTGYGYATADLALENKPQNMLLSLSAWSMDEQAEKDISYLLFDGTYYLGVTYKEILLNIEASREEVRPGLTGEPGPGDVIPAINSPVVEHVYTNAPDGWEFDLADNPVTSYTDPKLGDVYMHSRFGPVPAPYKWVFATKGDGTTYPESSVVIENYVLYFGAGFTPNNREALLTIRAKNRPNLKLDIPIRQLNEVSYYYENPTVFPTLFVTNGQQRETFRSKVYIPSNYGTEWRVKSVESTTGDASWITVFPGPGEAVRETWDLVITAEPLPPTVNYREALITIETTPSVRYTDEHGEWVENTEVFTEYLRVISGLDMDYNIVYPSGTNYYEDLNRTRRVIETPLNQEEPYTYRVNVVSTQRWSVLTADESWIHVTQPDFSHGSFNASFEVTVDVNPGDGHDIGGIKKARQSKVTIAGEQIYFDIMVYQGGWVQIGDDIWMDRNLMRSARKISPFRRNFADLSPAGLPVDQYLYPAAVPIAFPGGMTACYGKHRAATEATVPWTETRGYNQNGLGIQYSSPISENKDGYFSWGQPGSFLFKLYLGGYYTAYKEAVRHDLWDGLFNIEDNVLTHQSSRGINDPCPEGWRVPSYGELFWLNEHLVSPRRYHSGQEDLPLVANADDKNNGLFIVNSEGINCWFPYSGFRQSTNFVAAPPYSGRVSEVIEQGREGRSWSNLSTDYLNAFFFQFMDSSSIIGQDENSFGYTIRCIKE